MEFLGWAVLVIVGIVIALFVWASWWATTPEGKAHAAKVEEEKQAQQERFESLFAANGFPRDPWFVGKQGSIAIDPKGRRVAVQQIDWTRQSFRLAHNGRSIPIHHGDWEIFDFSQILGAELYLNEDRIMHTTGSRSLVGAAVGFAVAGGVGALIGGQGRATKTTEASTVKNVKLCIHLEDFSKPVREVEFFDPDIWMDPNGGASPALIDTAKEWVKRLELCVVMSERAKGERAEAGA